jgi:uncharacterized protein (DUF952 family)
VYFGLLCRREEKMLIYHIIAESEWQKAKVSGQYTPASLEAEGFIHTSTREQVVDTANRYYAGQDGLLLMEIEMDKVKPEVRFDPVTLHGAPTEFPHIYGPLNLDAVNQVIRFAPGENGQFSLPVELTRRN